MTISIADLTAPLKAAARKYALKAGTATAGWTDTDFVDYINDKGITGPKKNNAARKPAARCERPVSELRSTRCQVLAAAAGTPPFRWRASGTPRRLA